jgi:flavin-dependent dehydrogenase
MRKPKVIIVGSGPAGGATAVALGKLGAAEILLLDKSSYPRVKVCGSGLSPLALKVLHDLELEDRFPGHANIQGLVAKGPGGSVRALRGGGKGAWVVPRHEFDHTLAKAGEQLGATFRPETKVVELLRDGAGRVRGVRTTNESFEADLVVCADGAAGRFSSDATPRQTIQTIMGWWQGTTLPTDEAIMVWDRRLEGYYAWSFPEPNGVVNIGLTIPDGAPHASRLKVLFQDLLDEHFAYGMKGAEQRGKWMGHPAIIATSLGRMATPYTISVGEAARLVMPGTVEGIGFALESGVHAARFIADHFDATSGFSRLSQERYRLGAAARVLPKFWAGEAFVRMMRSRRAVDALGKIMNERVSKAVINAAARLTGDDITGEATTGAPPAPKTQRSRSVA